MSGRLAIHVEDHSIDVHEEDRERIFLPFSQSDSSVTRAYAGSGIGLALSLICLHGGTISLQTEVDKSSTFTIYHPLRK